LLVVLGAISLPGQTIADGYARVYLNGVPVPVWFNDGDTFRVQEGEFRGNPCRLSGFNTLESYGPVHQWGDWHPYELYVLAKMATMNGRRGTWHCTTTGERDTYGRLLTECPDLAIDQIRRGYAHMIEIDETPSRPEYIRAQQEAIRNRRGIWAHGVPDFVMTSLHSAHEDASREWHYNRLVSVYDGHSESMQHHERYSECEWVCNTETRVDRDAVREGARLLRADPVLAPQIADISNTLLIEIVSRFVRRGELPGYLPEALHAPLIERLTPMRDSGQLGQTHQAPGACMIYAEFERRYGPDRASCVRGHGNWTGRPGEPQTGGH
jgi:endonuclease YncB( thermonuclease family)